MINASFIFTVVSGLYFLILASLFCILSSHFSAKECRKTSSIGVDGLKQRNK